MCKALNSIFSTGAREGIRIDWGLAGRKKIYNACHRKVAVSTDTVYPNKYTFNNKDILHGIDVFTTVSFYSHMQYIPEKLRHASKC